MSWIKTGTISVTNASDIVIGSGTAWVGAAQAGYGIVMPNGLIYEIASVDSATQITLAKNYEGTTLGGQAYAIMPTQGLTALLVAAVNTLITNYQGVYGGIGQGKFPDGTVAVPGLRFAGDEDTGLRRKAANNGALVAGGADIIEWLANSIVLNQPVTGGAATFGATNVGRLKIGSNSANDVTDLALSANGVLNTEQSLSIGWENGGYARFLDAVTDVDGGTAGGAEVMRISGEGLQVLGISLISAEITVANEAVGLVDLPAGVYGACVYVSCGTDSDSVQNADSGLIRFDAGTSRAITAVSVGADFDTSTATLTGTTGAAGKTTVAPNSSRQLQIENQSGQTQTYRVFGCP